MDFGKQPLQTLLAEVSATNNVHFRTPENIEDLHAIMSEVKKLIKEEEIKEASRKDRQVERDEMREALSETKIAKLKALEAELEQAIYEAELAEEHAQQEDAQRAEEEGARNSDSRENADAMPFFYAPMSVIAASAITLAHGKIVLSKEAQKQVRESMDKFYEVQKNGTPEQQEACKKEWSRSMKHVKERLDVAYSRGEITEKYHRRGIRLVEKGPPVLPKALEAQKSKQGKTDFSAISATELEDVKVYKVLCEWGGEKKERKRAEKFIDNTEKAHARKHTPESTISEAMIGVGRRETSRFHQSYRDGISGITATAASVKNATQALVSGLNNMERGVVPKVAMV